MSPRVLPAPDDALTKERVEELDYLFATGHAAQALDEVVRHITYKVGWSFKVEQPFPFGPRDGLVGLRITARLPDSSMPGRMVMVSMAWPVHEGALMSVRSAQRSVYEGVLEMERHEASEFFRVDGTAPYWPHHEREGGNGGAAADGGRVGVRREHGGGGADDAE